MDVRGGTVSPKSRRERVRLAQSAGGGYLARGTRTALTDVDAIAVTDAEVSA